MATLSTFLTLPFIPRSTPTSSINTTSNTLCFKNPKVENFNISRGLKVTRLNKITASVVEEQETLIPDEQAAPEASQPSVSVSVSPSDILTMFFQAEGTMPETAISSVAKALEVIHTAEKHKIQPPLQRVSPSLQFSI
ncbi:hypothetical protein AgCh_012157 [Apium graveolens]